MAGVRTWIYLEPKTDKEIEKYAKDSGMKKAAFMAVAVVVGARALARVTNPEKFITPEMMKEIIKAQNVEAEKESA